MRLVLLLAVAATLAPPAAQAEPYQPAGLLCGFTAFADPTGAVDPDPAQRYGEIDGGPVVILPADGAEPVVSTTVTCSIQLNSVDASAPDVVRVSATGPGNVAVLPPTPITYRRGELDWDPLCTEYNWVTRSGTYTWQHDDVPEVPGVQCPYAISARS